jgi:hypothetical protein
LGLKLHGTYHLLSSDDVDGEDLLRLGRMDIIKLDLMDIEKSGMI